MFCAFTHGIYARRHTKHAVPEQYAGTFFLFFFFLQAARRYCQCKHVGDSLPERLAQCGLQRTHPYATARADTVGVRHGMHQIRISQRHIRAHKSRNHHTHLLESSRDALHGSHELGVLRGKLLDLQLRLLLLEGCERVYTSSCSEQTSTYTSKRHFVFPP